MRKILFIISILQLLVVHANACDMCNANSCNYVGILPQFQKNFVGLRWNNSNFVSQPMPSILQKQDINMQEKFNTVNLWGRFYPVKRVQLFVFVPFHDFQEAQQQQVTQSQGLGDISVSAFYTLINTGDSMTCNVKHTLLLGGGLKLPTGKFDNTAMEDAVSSALQNGSGSVDFPLHVMYTIRYKKVGCNVDVNYSFNTMNKDDYRYGNRFGSSLKIFYWKNLGAFSLLPNTGIMYEQTEKDVKGHFYQLYSGGTITLLTAGMESYYKNLSLGFSFQQPLAQNLSNNLVTSKYRILLNVTVMF